MMLAVQGIPLPPLLIFPLPINKPGGLLSRLAVSSESERVCQSVRPIQRHDEAALRRIPDALFEMLIPGAEANVGPATVFPTMDQNGGVVTPLDAVDERVDGLEDPQRFLGLVLHKVSLA